MSLFSSLSVSASGMAAQRARTDVLVENLANAETTRTPDGGPYRRKEVVFETADARSAFSSLLAGEMDVFSRQNPLQTGVNVSEALLVLHLAIEIAGVTALIVEGVEVYATCGGISKAIGLVGAQSDSFFLHQVHA